MENNDVQRCPICQQPIEGVDHPDADVYHMSCLMVEFESIRAKQKEQRRGYSNEVGKGNAV